MWKCLIRPLMIFLPFFAGATVQMLFQWSWRCGTWNLATWAIRIALMIIFFLLCLQIDVGRTRLTPTHGWIFLANVLMGVIPYGILKWFGWDDLALAAFFVGISPTANAAPVVMAFLNGRVEFVLSGFVLTNLGVNLMLIGLIPWVTGRFEFDFAFQVFQQLLLVVGAPAAVAFACRRRWPELRELPKKCRMLSFGLWCATLFVVSATATAYFASTPDAPLARMAGVAGISLLLCALNFWIGARLAPRRIRRESSQTLGQKNTTLTIFLAMTFGGPAGAFVALGPTFYVLWHNSWNALQMFLYDRRKSRVRKTAPDYRSAAR